MTTKKLLLSKIDEAKREMGEAEADLEKVLREIRVAPRAEKTTITAVVGDAFDKLKSARASLEDLETILARDDP